MPLRWVEPELFMTHNDVSVYHVYNVDVPEVVLTFWYTTDVTEDACYEFDVRHLPNPTDAHLYDPESHKEIIRHAIEQHLLTIPQ